MNVRADKRHNYILIDPEQLKMLPEAKALLTKREAITLNKGLANNGFTKRWMLQDA